MTKTAFPNRIDISLFGIDVIHEPEFVIDRPSGNGFYVFVHFHSPIYLRGADGADLQHFGRGTAILYAPGSPTWYSSIDSEMRHSWFHCSGPGVVDCIRRFALPINRPLDIDAFNPLIPFLKEVQREQIRKEAHWEESVSLRAAVFFLDLGRAVQQREDPHITPYEREVREALRQVREVVHSDIARAWTVNEMADLAHLSPSRFTALYSRFFEMSPMNDLIEARLRQARSLLQQTATPVEQVAVECGFGSTAHFSRLFRRRVGCPPSRYRQSVPPDPDL